MAGNEVGLLIFGVAVGAAVAVPTALLIARGKMAGGHEAAVAQADAMRGERDATRAQLERTQSEVRSLEVELARAEARADETARAKATALHESQESHARVEAALREAHAREIAAKSMVIDELKGYLETADETLKATFGDASAKALQTATESFLELAKKRFDERDEIADQSAEIRKRELEKLLEPMQRELGELEKLNREIEKERAEAFGSLRETIGNLNRSNESLANALKKPSVRGSWGQGQLTAILESSGWEQGREFDVEDVTEEDGKTLRTDVLIHLSRGRKIIIDSKAPLDQYMLATEAETEEERARLCREHAKAVRGHLKDLQKKEYWKRYAGSPPYVILFLPYEAAYQIACEHDRALLDDAHRSRIVLANPMTLMNLIHLASYVLNEERASRSADEIRQHGKQLCERLGKVMELIEDHGRHLRIAAESHNKLVASMGSRLLPSANRMRELGAGAPNVLETPETVDTAIRHLIAPEMPMLEGLGVRE